MKKFVCSSAVVLMSLLFSAGAVNSYGIPDAIQDGNILHCFNWSMNQIKAELPKIAEAGFGAVQISPLQRSDANAGSEWHNLYRPYDIAFKPSSGLGTASDLKSLCSEAEKYGIKIIVDVVANHVDRTPGYHDSWWDASGRVRWDGSINYGSRYSITHGQLGDYGDVNSEDAQVIARAKAYVQTLKDMGVKGIRWDAAKHIALPSESCGFWTAVTSIPGMWHYGEMLDQPGPDSSIIKEYTNYMSVTDNRYCNYAARENGGIPTGYGGDWVVNYGCPASKMVYWGESHDNYANDEWSQNVDQSVIDRAYAAYASRDGVTALYLSRPNAKGFSNIRLGKGTTAFTSRHIAEVNKFRNAMTGKKDWFESNGQVCSITRQGGGAVIVAKGSGNVSVANGGGYCPSGTYIDKVAGGTFTVTNSTISGNVGSSGIVVIYKSDEPAVIFSPDVKTFKTETLSVTASLKNATSGWVEVDGGSRQTFSSTKTFVIGENVAPGTEITIRWSATGASGTATGSVTYKKVAASAVVTIYYSNPQNWNNVYCYAYNENSSDVNSEWPGCQASYDANLLLNGKKGWWKYDLPDNLSSCRVIFNNGASAQYPAQNQPGLAVDGASMALDGTSWSTPTIGGTIGGGETTTNKVYFDNSLTQWTTPYIHYWGATESSWPGVAMSLHENNIWMYEVPEGTTGCLFNAGDGDATKTSDFVCIPGHLYDKNGDKGVYSSNGGNEEGEEMPEALYIIGNLASGQWDTSSPVAMTKDGSKFVADNVKFIAPQDSENAYFSFITTMGENWDVVNGADRYGAETADCPLLLGEPAPFIKFAVNVNASAAYSWMITPGTYNVVADFKTNTVKIESQSAIELVDVYQNVTPIYFDMQGRRVLSPSQGIYIVRRGEKITKEVIK